ncbi:MAG: manganese efflux pump MntP family protein [Oscillospiraceae bacterium]|nr:manganese efflux pump MntP family protein [Oscillospiraceae bacterium]
MFQLIQIFLIGAGLSADAFAVSITNGLSYKNLTRADALKIALSFGVFQAVMPLLGFLLGAVFAEFINSFAHFIALIFLGFIGVKMLIDEIGSKKEIQAAKTDIVPEKPEKLSAKLLIIQAIATSIDALIAGVVFISMGITGGLIFGAVGIIGATTFAFSFAGVYLGRKFGALLGGKAKIVGGVILIGIGVKIFLEHYFS